MTPHFYIVSSLCLGIKIGSAWNLSLLVQKQRLTLLENIYLGALIRRVVSLAMYILLLQAIILASK